MREGYHLSIRERLLYGGVAGLIGVAVTMVFYHSIWIALLVGLVLFGVYPEFCREALAKRRQWVLVLEFKEVLYSLAAALRAGRSLENALDAVWEDMDPRITPCLYKEWEIIRGQLQMRIRAEDCLKELAYRSGVEEIQSLADVIEISKKSEGDIVQIIENTVRLLQDKIEIRGEMHVLLAKKKMEQKIVNTMPFLIIIMLLFIAPDYLAPLYETVQGRIIMTLCAGMAGGSFWLSRKISDIEL